MDAGKALAELNSLEERVREAEDKVKRAAAQPLGWQPTAVWHRLGRTKQLTTFSNPLGQMFDEGTWHHEFLLFCRLLHWAFRIELKVQNGAQSA